jgi:hypothetical protein
MNRRSIIFALLVASFGCIPQVQATPKPSLGFGADTSASDNGWGGGNTKSDLVDGLASYYDTWMHGLAAPLGQPYFHVVLDFASDTTFNSVVAWWHRDVGGQAVPNDVDIQIWNAVTLAWVTVFSTTNARDSLGPYDDPATWTSRPTAFYFATCHVRQIAVGLRQFGTLESVSRARVAPRSVGLQRKRCTRTRYSRPIGPRLGLGLCRFVWNGRERGEEDAGKSVGFPGTR